MTDQYLAALSIITCIRATSYLVVKLVIVQVSLMQYKVAFAPRSLSVIMLELEVALFEFGRAVD